MSEDVRPGGTYKTLAEQREVLTPAEERFERFRQILISEPTSNTASATIVVPMVIPITKMVRSGIAFDIIGLILIVLLIPIMARLVGFV